MMECKEFLSLLDAYLEGTLQPDDMARMRAHERECPACAGEAQLRRDCLALSAEAQMPEEFSSSWRKQIREEKQVEKRNVVVVAGFQGINRHGDITTLGRGGSDTTAVALAAFLRADLCQIYTDVDGVYDRDPRRYPDAQRFSEISYEEMLGLIQNGAQVLHDRCVTLAREHNLQIEVLSAFTGAPGTLVG